MHEHDIIIKINCGNGKVNDNKDGIKELDGLRGN